MILRNSKFKISNYKLKADHYRYWLPVAGRRVILSKRFYILNTIFYILLFSSVYAQEIKINVQAKFSGDSVKIGKPIEFYLSARYPENLNILFPDSTFSFAPFELQKKIYFPTETKNGISRDSVVYHLA